MNAIYNKVGNVNFFDFKLVLIAFILLLLSCNSRKVNGTLGANDLETYRATWWHLPISGNWGRPTYGVVNIDNGKLVLRHAILEGRELGDYRLPYWPICSFVSIFSKDVELAHQGSVNLTVEGNNITFPFRCGDSKFSSNSMGNQRIEEGFELSRTKNTDILKVTNRGSESPILMEHFFVVEKNSNSIPIFIKTTNISDKKIQDVVLQISYSQDFNWSSFGVTTFESYKLIESPASGKTKSFFAFSSGMGKGFEFNVNEGCELFYKLDQEFNAWNVTINNTSTTLEPGNSVIFSYNLRIISTTPEQVIKNRSISKEELDVLEFTNVIPTEIKTAPVNPKNRITINDVIRNLDAPKVRGLHRITGLPKSLDDLALLKEWGGNLVITDGDPKDIKQIIERGHSLGMEMFVPGVGGYKTGMPPGFDQLFSANLRPSEFPDSYGQDEDHYYWYPVKATLDFKSEIGKLMSEATLEEKVTYWSRCFVNKWRKTLENVREHDQEGNIWFYMPTPSVANIDPFDYYDLFLKEITKLGDVLTVFPFYYGIDFEQIEYMMRRWKDAGASRAVFLPGGPTYSKPSQYMRAITAARRGGADGVCGFAFRVDEKVFDDEWRWKSLMLAAWANFPTPELDAYCIIEEPADLLEALSKFHISVVLSDSGSRDFIHKLSNLLPGEVQEISKLPEEMNNDNRLYIILSNNTSELKQNSEWSGTTWENICQDKGTIEMAENIVKICGPDLLGLQNAENLFLHFASLTVAENNSGKNHL